MTTTTYKLLTPTLIPSHATVLALFEQGDKLCREQIIERTGLTHNVVKHALTTLVEKELIVRANSNRVPALFVGKQFFVGEQINLARDSVLTYLRSAGGPRTKSAIRLATKLARKTVSDSVSNLLARHEIVCTSRDARPALYIDKAREKDYVLHANSGAQSTVNFAIKRQPNSVFDLARF